jgi:hypothetical protein
MLKRVAVLTAVMVMSVIAATTSTGSDSAPGSANVANLNTHPGSTGGNAKILKNIPPGGQPKEHVSLVYGKVQTTNLGAKSGNGYVNATGTTNPKKPKIRPRTLRLNGATTLVSPPK